MSRSKWDGLETSKLAAISKKTMSYPLAAISKKTMSYPWPRFVHYGVSVRRSQRCFLLTSMRAVRDNTQCPPGTTIFMSMNHVGWSQDSIRSQFQDGRDIQSEVNRYLAMSQGERVRALQALPTIRVVGFVEQGWIALDNRRLAVFRSVLAPGTRMPFVIATANEARELINKLTTVNSGTSVVVRSNPRYTINRRVNRM